MRNETMKKHLCIAWIALCAALVSCATTGGSGDAISLDEAIEQSAAEIAAELPEGIRVVIVGFSSEHESLSEYIMDELTGALVDGGLEVADRRNLPYVYKELNFQMSGEVSDESAVSIGKYLGASHVIFGQLVNAGGSRRYRLSGVNAETAVQESSTRLRVRSDRALRDLIAAVKKDPVSATAASYGESGGGPPKTAGAFFDRGILFGSRGDFDLAIEDFTEAIKLDPNMAAAYLQRSKALHASVSKVSNLDKNFNFTTTGTGYSEKTRDVYNRALEDASAAIKLAPALSSAYRNRGRLHNDMGEHDKAIGDYNQAIRIDPGYAVAYSNRGVAYYDKKDYDRAIADYNQAIRIDPGYAVAYNNRGNAYDDKKDYDRAIADYTQAIKIDPDYAYPYNNRGLVYANKGDYDRAIADYNQAIKIDPDYAAAYNNRGLAYDDKKDYDRAIADYNQAIMIDPVYAYAYNNRGFAYYNKKDYDRAIADYNQAMRLDPDYAAAYDNRGNAYNNSKKDYDRAIADYTQAIRLDPDNADNAYYNPGNAYRDKGDYKRARADYEQLLRLDPNDAVARGNLDALGDRGR
jgi:tetratricopeptide (TPR) repeat protein